MKRLNTKESLPDGVRRLLDLHVKNALAQLSAKTRGDEAIHEARKSLKRARSILRLVRPALGESYRTENDFLGSIGQKVSQARDAQVLMETLDKIEKSSGMKFPAARERLQQDGEAHQRTPRTVVPLLRKASQSIAKLHLADVAFPTLAAGMHRTIKRGRSALAAVREQPSGEGFHDLRKRVKDLRYQLEAVSAWWPDIFKAYAQAARRLEQDLGEDHDLHVLASTVGEGQPEILPHIEKAQAKLRKKANRQASLLYADGPKIWRRRLEEIWRAAAA